jgi:hypothetical protein
MKRRWVAGTIIALALAVAITALGQYGGGQAGPIYNGPNGGGGFGMRTDCLIGGAHFGDGSGDTSAPRNINRAGFVYARVKYHTQQYRRGFGGGGEVPWHHDYPDGDTMFPDNLQKLTTVTTDPDSFQIVDIDSKELFKYPFIYMSEPGFLDLYPEDVKNLREYFDRGGFLLMDDFRGNNQNFSQYQIMQNEMAKVFPDRTIETIPANHPIFHSFFELNPSDMLPPYSNQDSGPVQFLGIMDDKQRIQVMIDFNNDISEYWQALDRGTCSIHESGRAVQLGVNYAIYALTH